MVDIHGVGKYEMYVNRDSLSYRQIYGIEDVQTIIRGTLRCRGYCDAWNALVQLGLTNDTITIEHTNEMTLSDLLRAHLTTKDGPLRRRTANYLGIDENSEVVE